MSQNPIVSVVMITYGHENYIREAIEGVLMQNCDFEVELIVANDCSPDKTDLIIKDIIQNHPRGNWIKYHHHEKNLGMMPNFIFALQQAKGNYIALCDGDDYWIDALKLQKQVDFLELNSSYSLVCSAYKSVFAQTNEEEVILKDKETYEDNTANGFDITIERFLKDWLTQPLTLLFRKEYYNLKDLNIYKYTRDVHFIYHLLKKANGYYMKEVFGVYNIHGQGVFTSTSSTQRLIIAYEIYKELYQNNKEDKFLKKVYVNFLYNLINNKAYLDNSLYKVHKLVWELFGLIENKNDFKKALRIVNTQYIGIKNIFKKRV